MDILNTIREKVEEAKDLPNATIEYSFELPENRNIKEDSFYGVPAKFNKMVPNSAGCVVTFKY